MSRYQGLAAILCLLAGCALEAAPAAAVETATVAKDAKEALLEYLRSQNSTGLLVIRNGKTLVEKSWPAPQDDRQFQLFVYGPAPDGALLEDVASQQKSFVAVLVAIALDKGLIDLDKPVSAYLGAGWSKATPEQEAKIRVDDVLRMSSGLDEAFRYTAPAGSAFFYNTPVYAITKRVLEAAAEMPLDTLTREWLTVPAGMADTAWRKRPAALASVGNQTGLVTTPHDVSLFGRIVLGRGIGATGSRVVSEKNLGRLFEPAPTNPSYGRLWWLNDGAFAIRAGGGRTEGQLIAAAPRDTVAALGAFDRCLYVVPSRGLIIVRTGAAAADKDFDQHFWLLLGKVIH